MRGGGSGNDFPAVPQRHVTSSRPFLGPLLSDGPKAPLQLRPCGSFLSASGAFADLLGYLEYELLLLNFGDLVHPTSRKAWTRVRHSLAQGVLSALFTCRLVHKNGSDVWCVVSCSLLTDAQSEEPEIYAEVTETIEGGPRLCHSPDWLVSSGPLSPPPLSVLSGAGPSPHLARAARDSPGRRAGSKKGRRGEQRTGAGGEGAPGSPGTVRRSKSLSAMRPGTSPPLGEIVFVASGGGTGGSRYHKDFEELALLGRGAFGHVYSVRHKIDGNEYAIKKIRLNRAEARQEQVREEVLREVKCLARLDHPNVVRYFQSWVEAVQVPLSASGAGPAGFPVGSPRSPGLAAAVQPPFDPLPAPRSPARASPHTGRSAMTAELRELSARTSSSSRTDDSPPAAPPPARLVPPQRDAAAAGPASPAASRPVAVPEPRRAAAPRGAFTNDPSEARGRPGAFARVAAPAEPGRARSPPPAEREEGGGVPVAAGGALVAEEGEGAAASLGPRAGELRPRSLSVDTEASSWTIDEMERDEGDEEGASDDGGSEGDDSLGALTHGDGRSLARSHARHPSAISLASVEEEGEAPRRPPPPDARRSSGDFEEEDDEEDEDEDGEEAAWREKSRRGADGGADGDDSELERMAALETAGRLCVPQALNQLAHSPIRSPRTFAAAATAAAAARRTRNEFVLAPVGPSSFPPCAAAAGLQPSHPRDPLLTIAVPSGSPVPPAVPGSLPAPPRLTAAPAAGRPRCSPANSPRAGGPRAVRTEVVLFIQMQLCSSESLATWMRRGAGREARDRAEVLDIVRQVAEGLAHVHAQGVIHRDLKPANVFLVAGPEGGGGAAAAGGFPPKTIKIGDFGLAKELEAIAQRDGRGPRQPSSATAFARRSGLNEEFTPNVGSALYAAPEQIACSARPYSEKVDIYSLGVIACELLAGPFGTDMERVAVLDKLRRGRLPPDFERSEPEAARFIRWLVSPAPGERPTAREVLECGLLRQGDGELGRLQARVRSHEGTIEDQRKVIEELRRQLSHLEGRLAAAHEGPAPPSEPPRSPPPRSDSISSSADSLSSPSPKTSGRDLARDAARPPLARAKSAPPSPTGLAPAPDFFALFPPPCRCPGFEGASCACAAHLP